MNENGNPLFDIGDIFYDGTNQAYLNKLHVLHNRAIRIILRLPSRSNADEGHQKLGILHLNIRRKLHITQLAQWIADQELFKDSRNLRTRSHTPGRRNSRLEKPKKHISKVFLS